MEYGVYKIGNMESIIFWKSCENKNTNQFPSESTLLLDTNILL